MINFLMPSKSKTAAFSLAAIFLTGCVHHERHDAHFQRADFGSRLAIKSHYNAGDELNESDVLGHEHGRVPSEEDIQKAMANSGTVAVREGDSILVLQSGEPAPDQRMVKELNKHYRAIPFTGIRREWPHGDAPGDAGARSLRFAAAQAGAQKILCYWGELEVAHHGLITKTVTWLPVVDVVIPDQIDHARMHLKVALIDVKSGAWTIFRTEPIETALATTGWGRNHVESPEINSLKRKCFVAAVNSMASQKSF